MIPQNNFDEAKKSNDQIGQCIDFGKPRPTNFVKRERFRRNTCCKIDSIRFIRVESL